MSKAEAKEMFNEMGRGEFYYNPGIGGKCVTDEEEAALEALTLDDFISVIHCAANGKQLPASKRGKVAGGGKKAGGTKKSKGGGTGGGARKKKKASTPKEVPSDSD